MIVAWFPSPDGLERGQPDDGLPAAAVLDEVLDGAGQGRSQEADEGEVLAALAGGLPRLILGVGGEALVPADQPEAAVAREGGVHQGQAAGAGVGAQHLATGP